MITCKELRARARWSLEGKIFGKTWLFTILAYIMVNTIVSIASVILFGLGGMVIAGPLNVGLATFYLNMIRDTDEKNNFMPIFYSFKCGKRYWLSVLTTLYTSLWSILFFIPGIVKSFSYALAPYIMAEYSDMSANLAITRSREMMDGNKAKLFKLRLSFIGWYIVAGIFWPALPWVITYQQTAEAEFYDEIKANYRYF